VSIKHDYVTSNKVPFRKKIVWLSINGFRRVTPHV